MAKTRQPNSAGSQFFVNVVDKSNPYASFDSTYSVSSDEIQEMDVVDAPSQVTTDANDIPLRHVTIIKAELLG